MFLISSSLLAFNSFIFDRELLYTLLLRYPQRKKSGGDKSGLLGGQFMSAFLDISFPGKSSRTTARDISDMSGELVILFSLFSP